MTRLQIAVALLSGNTTGHYNLGTVFNVAEEVLRYEAQLQMDESGCKDLEAARIELLEMARAKDEAEELAKQNEEVPF